MKLTTDQEERLARIRSSKDRSYWRARLLNLGGFRRDEFVRTWVQPAWSSPPLLVIHVAGDSTTMTVQGITSDARQRIADWLGGDAFDPHAPHAEWADWGWTADDAHRRPTSFGSMMLHHREAVEFRLIFADDPDVVFRP